METNMRLKTLDCVVLKEDLPELDLRAGDVGTIVEIYPPDGVEVEFVAATGETKAVVSLPVRAVRSATASDMLAVRPSTV
jgi:hypothetical protein